MKNLFYKTIIAFLSVTSVTSCVEPYVLQTNTFEEALVVEATITNELKQQEIKITKTYKLEQNQPTQVFGATVLVVDNLGTQFTFQEINGKYISNNPFQAIPGRTYQLKIRTSNGRKYSSSVEALTTVSPLTNVLANAVTRSDGKTGIEITAKSFDPTNTSKYYRFEYEETYKIVAPLWRNVIAVPTIIGYTPLFRPIYQMYFFPRTTEAKTCYTTKNSDRIIVTSTSNLSEDRVNFPVQFLEKSDYKIANRYSILVKQYVQNLASYTFYKTLNEISGSGNILSQTQPGFLIGNISSESDPEEKVIGYFDVSSFSKQRIFLNHDDFFPYTPNPSYPYNKCVAGSDTDLNPFRGETFLDFCFSAADNTTCAGETIINLLENNTSVYYNNAGIRYELYPTPCGDCTSFSSNIRPLFWID